MFKILPCIKPYVTIAVTTLSAKYVKDEPEKAKIPPTITVILVPNFVTSMLAKGADRKEIHCNENFVKAILESSHK
jgi:hypothetical protein